MHNEVIVIRQQTISFLWNHKSATSRTRFLVALLGSGVMNNFDKVLCTLWWCWNAFASSNTISYIPIWRPIIFPLRKVHFSLIHYLAYLHWANWYLYLVKKSLKQELCDHWENRQRKKLSHWLIIGDQEQEKFHFFNSLQTELGSNSVT